MEISKKESIQNKKERLNFVIETLEKEYPAAQIALEFKNPLELLIATILSAQCTDERVNKVTFELFKKYKSPEDYFAIPQEELEKDIFSTGFYKAKARNIQLCCRLLVEKFGGEVPNTRDKLTSLAGVGRKTANVVLGHWFGVAAMVVDTHVIRLVNLLGFSTSKDAEKIEYELMDLVPKGKWVLFTHLMISHGRAVCIARRPQCQKCVISEMCPSAK